MGHGDYVASAMDGVDTFTHQPYRSVNGDPSCPCLSLPVYRSFLANASVARTSDGNGTVMLYSYGEDGVYPGDYGVGCHAHDSMLPPNCLLGQYCDKGQALQVTPNEHIMPAWCAMPWCYVDTRNCSLPDVTTPFSVYSYFPRTAPAYSYQTCGAVNIWGGFIADRIFAPLPPPSPSPPPPPLEPPTLPPPLPPPPLPPPNFMTTPAFTATLGFFGTLLIFVLVPLTIILARRLRMRAIAAKADARKKARAQIDHAITGVSSVTAPIILMSLDRFRKLGRLYSHEEAADEGLLTIIHDLNGLKAFAQTHATLFVSHQWLGLATPDPLCQQYSAIVKGCDALCAQRNIAPESLFVWLDYHSVQQPHAAIRQCYIDALPFFAATCQYFLVVAPSATHEGGHVCDEASYRSRGWCRLELFAHLAVGGSKTMYRMTGEPSALSLRGWDEDRTGGHSEWLLPVLNVYSGTFTVDSDRYKLVAPMLGLWATTLLGSKGSVSKELHDLYSGLTREEQLRVFPTEHFGGLIEMLEDMSYMHAEESSIMAKEGGVEEQAQAEEGKDRSSMEETVAKVKGENSLAALRSVHRSHRALASLAAAAEASEKRRQSTRRPPRSIATAGDTIMKARRLLHDNLDAVRRIGKRDTAAPAMAPAPVALGGVQEAGEDDDADGGESGWL